jgi:endoribonuclease Dicer
MCLFHNLTQYLKKHQVIPDPYTIPIQSGSSDVECIEAPKPLGDVFESVAGAIFLDSGLDVLEVWRVCHPMLEKFIGEFLHPVLQLF